MTCQGWVRKWWHLGAWTTGAKACTAPAKYLVNGRGYCGKHLPTAYDAPIEARLKEIREIREKLKVLYQARKKAMAELRKESRLCKHGRVGPCPGCGTNKCLGGCGKNLGPYEECSCP